MDREDAEQTASKKRRSELSSFSIAATLSCDDLSRADTDSELRSRHGLPCMLRCSLDMWPAGHPLQAISVRFMLAIEVLDGCQFSGCIAMVLHPSPCSICSPSKCISLICMGNRANGRMLRGTPVLGDRHPSGGLISHWQLWYQRFFFSLKAELSSALLRNDGGPGIQQE